MFLPAWRGKYTRLLLTFVQRNQEKKKGTEEMTSVQIKISQPKREGKRYILNNTRIVILEFDNLLDLRPPFFFYKEKVAFLIIFPDKTTSETRE